MRLMLALFLTVSMTLAAADTVPLEQEFKNNVKIGFMYHGQNPLVVGKTVNHGVHDYLETYAKSTQFTCLNANMFEIMYRLGNTTSSPRVIVVYALQENKWVVLFVTRLNWPETKAEKE